MYLKEKVLNSRGLGGWKVGIAIFQGQKIRGGAGFWVEMEIMMGLAWERPSLRGQVETSN